MAIRASDNALSNLAHERFRRNRSDNHLADASNFLSANMIEFEHDRIRCAAIDARVFAKMLRNQPPVVGTLPLRSLTKHRSEWLALCRVIGDMNDVFAVPTI
jgi:hypothetical protein